MISAAPRAAPITVKVPVVPPGAITTLAGCKFTSPPGLAERETIAPLGATALRVMVPFIVFVSPTTPELSVIVIVGKVTFTVAVPDAKPGAEAVIVVVPPRLPGVTVTFTLVKPGGTVTFAGTVATPGTLLARLTTWPPGPAGAGSNRVSIPCALPKFSSLSRNEIPAPPDAVTVTVAGMLFAKPLFTMSCTT